MEVLCFAVFLCVFAAWREQTRFEKRHFTQRRQDAKHHKVKMGTTRDRVKIFSVTFFLQPRLLDPDTGRPLMGRLEESRFRRTTLSLVVSYCPLLRRNDPMRTPTAAPQRLV